MADGLDRTRQGEKHPEVKTYIKSSHILGNDAKSSW